MSISCKSWWQSKTAGGLLAALFLAVWNTVNYWKKVHDSLCYLSLSFQFLAFMCLVFFKVFATCCMVCLHSAWYLFYLGTITLHFEWFATCSPYILHGICHVLAGSLQPLIWMIFATFWHITRSRSFPENYLKPSVWVSLKVSWGCHLKGVWYFSYSFIVFKTFFRVSFWISLRFHAVILIKASCSRISKHLSWFL